MAIEAPFFEPVVGEVLTGALPEPPELLVLVTLLLTEEPPRLVVNVTDRTAQVLAPLKHLMTRQPRVVGTVPPLLQSVSLGDTQAGPVQELPVTSHTVGSQVVVPA